MIDKNKFEITVITPTIGRDNLEYLIETIEAQTISDKIFHLLLWDETREEGSKLPEEYNSDKRYSIVCPWGLGKNGNAPGSALRAVGLMSAFTKYVTFADDDIQWDPNHAETMLDSIQGFEWTSCFRKMFTEQGEYLGQDLFESVGDYPSRSVSYEMIDNNCMMFKREYGVPASQLYRFTTERNDDRLMYDFLKKNAGTLGRTNKATVNHISPIFLEDFFRVNCTK